MFISLSHLCLGQRIKSMGFTQKIIPHRSGIFSEHYRPKLKLLNDTLYVCSNTGIYRKNLKDDTEWTLYAFENIPIIEFVKNKNKILAISTGSKDGTDSLLFLSNDNGKTHINYTSSHFLEYGKNYLSRISQNPENENTILVLHVNSGISKSEDFGLSWELLNGMNFGEQNWHLGFHPLDTTTLYCTGETTFFAGTLIKSSDYGKTWSFYTHPGGDNCIHSIAFHPTNPDILVYSGELAMGKSTNKGETWNVIDLYHSGMYFYKVLFDEENPLFLYSSGTRIAPGNDTIRIYRSADMSESWHFFYKEFVGAEGCDGSGYGWEAKGCQCGSVLDMVQYKNKLIFYTIGRGLLELDLGANTDTPTSAPDFFMHQQSLIVFPNPAHDILQFKTETAINQVEIIDLTGRIVLKTNISNHEQQIDISKLNSGIYFAVFYANALKITKKIIIEK